MPAFAVKLSDDAVVLACARPSLEEIARKCAPARRASELKRAYDAEQTSDVVVARRGDVVLLSVGPHLHRRARRRRSQARRLDLARSVCGQRGVCDSREARQRSQARGDRKSAFAFSLVVLFGLIAFYLIRKLGDFAERAREWFEARSDKDLSLRFQGIEFVRPAMLRGAGVLALNTLKWLAQAGVAYTWLVVVLSLFESTRGYTQKLTGFVVAPLSQLMARMATALPLIVVAALAALAVFVLVRFVGLFFASVGRGEAALGWLPNDLAAPTSVLLRSGIIISALVFLAPIVTGDNDGVLGRVGVISLVALGLASTPVLASGTVGAIWLYGRRLRVGEFVELELVGAASQSSTCSSCSLIVTDRTELWACGAHLLTLVRPDATARRSPAPHARPVRSRQLFRHRGALAPGHRSWQSRRGSERRDRGRRRRRDPFSDRRHLRIARSAHGFPHRGARRAVQRRHHAREKSRVSDGIWLLLGLLLLAYLGSNLVGGRAIRGFGLPSGSEYLVLGFALGPHVLDVLGRSLAHTFEPVVLVGTGWLALVIGVGYVRVADRWIDPGRAAAGVLLGVLTCLAVSAAVYFAAPLFGGFQGFQRLAIALGMGACASATTRHCGALGGRAPRCAWQARRFCRGRCARQRHRAAARAHCAVRLGAAQRAADGTGLGRIAITLGFGGVLGLASRRCCWAAIFVVTRAGARCSAPACSRSEPPIAPVSPCWAP